MAWEWAGQAGTAAVGIVGIGIAYRTGREARKDEIARAAEERKHQVQQLHRQERLACYATFLETVAEVDVALTDLGLELARQRAEPWPRNLADDVPSAASGVLKDLIYKLRRWKAEVDLRASDATRYAAGAVLQDCVEAWKETLDSDDGWRMVDGAKRDLLITAMRDELGYLSEGSPDIARR